MNATPPPCVSPPASTWPPPGPEVPEVLLRARSELPLLEPPSTPARALAEPPPALRRRPDGLSMLDLFSGSGSASRAALVRGWRVCRVDNAPGTAHDVRADLASWQTDERWDLVWASPPCTELSTASRVRDVDAGLVLVRLARELDA